MQKNGRQFPGEVACMFLFGPLPIRSTANMSHVHVVSCPHRAGTLLTFLRMGNASTIQLQYHTIMLLAECKYLGWAFVKLLNYFLNEGRPGIYYYCNFMYSPGTEFE